MFILNWILKNKLIVINKNDMNIYKYKVCFNTYFVLFLVVVIIYTRVFFETIEKIDLVYSERYKRLPKIFKIVFCFSICIFNILIIKNKEDRIFCILPCKAQEIHNKKTNKIANKIYKYFNKGTFIFVFSSNVKYEEEFKKLVQKHYPNNIIWLHGKWLFAHLIFMILEYISELEQVEIKEQKIDVLVNDLSDITFYDIKELARRVKRLKIVTPQMHKYKKIEKELYENEGIAIELSNNMKKSLVKSNLIINIDFPSEILNKYKINKNAVIIHVNEKVKIESIGFNGITINDCKLSFIKSTQNKFEEEIYNDFSPNILYESYLYRKAKPENIIKQISNDNVKIEYLIGNKGRINELEFKNLL